MAGNWLLFCPLRLDLGLRSSARSLLQFYGSCIGKCKKWAATKSQSPLSVIKDTRCGNARYGTAQQNGHWNKPHLRAAKCMARSRQNNARMEAKSRKAKGSRQNKLGYIFGQFNWALHKFVIAFAKYVNWHIILR